MKTIEKFMLYLFFVFYIQGTYIMKLEDELQLLLDDHIMNTQQISFSPYKAIFDDEINEWDQKLKLSQEVLFLWIEVQK